MALVRLFFTCDVTISPIAKDETAWNELAREPVLQVARAADNVIIKAQVQFTVRGNPEMSRGGVAEKTQGYLVVRVDQIAARGYTPQRGDKIVSIPGETGVYFVTSVTPRAHKGGRNRTLHIFFEDRQSVKGA